MEGDSSNPNSNGNWSALPDGLVGDIGKLLNKRIDILRFRSVSTSWRSMVSTSQLQTQSKLINLPPPIKSTAILTHFTICRLEDKSRTSACLVKVVESSSFGPGELKLVHPLTYQKADLNKLGRSINLLDFRLVELSKGISLEFEKGSYNFKIRKVFLFRKEGYIVLLHSGKLLHWANDAQECDELGGLYRDLVKYNNKYYVIDMLGILHYIDDITLEVVGCSTPTWGKGNIMALVESEGYLYVLDFYLRKKDYCPGGKGIKLLFRYDIQEKEWVREYSLGDRVFVLSEGLSYSVDVMDFPGCQKNCVYYAYPELSSRLGVCLLEFSDSKRPGNGPPEDWSMASPSSS